MLELLQPALEHLCQLPREQFGIGSLRRYLVDEQGQRGAELAMKIERESSRLYKPVCMLLNRVRAWLDHSV